MKRVLFRFAPFFEYSNTNMKLLCLVVKVESIEFSVQDVGCIDAFKANKLIFVENKNDLVAQSNMSVRIYTCILHHIERSI